MIAALYVQRGGAYWNLEGVDPWDEARDARLYAGPWPVVAHPPCVTWSRLAEWAGYEVGADGDCFVSALECVVSYGGVLEHPAHSRAWKAFCLPMPTPGGGWRRDLFGTGWACEVEQGHYGHRARKPTWLYVVGATPPPLRWGPSQGLKVEQLWGASGERDRTPPEFRDVLLGIARSVTARSEVA